MANDFYNDIRRGKVGEKLFADAYARAGHKVEDVSDNLDYRRRDIDFIVSNKRGQTTTIEIKTDEASEYTGNVFVEYANINNKSHDYLGWLMYCEAEYIGFVQPHNRRVLIVSFAELSAHIKENSYRCASSSNATGFLIPISALETLKSYSCMEL